MSDVLEKNLQEKRLETIMSYPLNQVRYWASGQFAEQKFSPELFETLIDKVRPIAFNPETFEAELENVRQALKTGVAPNTPKLSDPHLQILWGGALATLANTPKVMASWDETSRSDSLPNLPLWGQIAHCPDARTELRENAFILATSLKNPETRIRWGAPDNGYPDVSYYFNPSENMINLDMVWSLMIGMEQSRSANLHEIGHSQGTINTPEGILKARQELKALSQTTKDKSFPKEQRQEARKQMNAKALEHKLRFLIFDEAENNYANRYAVNQSERSAQDFGVAVNTLETTLCLPLMGGIGKVSSDQQAPSPMDRFINVKKVLRYSFYVNNGIVDDTAEGWKSLGIDLAQLSGLDKGGNTISAEDSLKDMRALCTQLESLQPTSKDRLFGQRAYNKKAEDCSKKRCEIIDEIYDRFISPLTPEILKEQEKQQEENKKNQQQQQQNQDQDQDQDGQQQQSGGGGSGGEGGESMELGEDSDGQESNDSGQNQQGKSGKGKSSSQSSDPDSDDDMDSDPSDDAKETDVQKKLEDMKRQMSDAVKKLIEDAEKEDGEDNNGKDGQSKEGKEGKQSDSKEGKDGKDGNKSDGKDAKDGENKDQGETLDDLVNNKNDDQNTQTSSDSKNSQDKPENKKGERQEVWTGQPKSGNGKASVNDFLPSRLRESNEYKDIVARHEQTARRVKNLLVRLQNEYFGKEKESSKRVLVPEDNDIDKFDLGSYVDRKKKLATGQEVDERDYEHFKVKGDKEKIPAPIDIAILIDRSGSMGKGKGSKLDLALSTACVLYEAARKNPYFNVYITAMGEPNALSVAEPGQSEEEIAKKIMTVQDVCGGCQDHMQDAILSTMAKIKGNKKQEYTGASHFFVISDGNFGDEAFSVPVVKEICESTNKNITFNFILTEKNKNKIEVLGDEKSKGMGSERIDRVHISGESGIDSALTSMLNRRMVEMKRIPAQRNTQKASQMGKLLDTLNAQRNQNRR